MEKEYGLFNPIGRTWLTSAHQGYVEGNMRSNTLSAFHLAALRGADMIETDARASRDGVLILNHDPVVRGFTESGEPVEYEVGDTDYSVLRKVVMARDEYGVQYLATLEEALHLCYRDGMIINIDLKNGAAHAEKVARLVLEYGMRGRAIYATNGAGAQTINRVLELDPDARFIDTPRNYTAESLRDVENYTRRCFAYTADFSAGNIRSIRDSGCMLAAISLNAQTIESAMRWHPDMCEYPHTSDFLTITREIIDKMPVM